MSDAFPELRAQVAEKQRDWEIAEKLGDYGAAQSALEEAWLVTGTYIQLVNAKITYDGVRGKFDEDFAAIEMPEDPSTDAEVLLADIRSWVRKADDGVKTQNFENALQHINEAYKSLSKLQSEIEKANEVVNFELEGVCYSVSQEEWPAQKERLRKEMHDKYLVPFGKTIKIYNDDYLYLQKIAEGAGSVSGVLIAMVEVATLARVPTDEMNWCHDRYNKLKGYIDSGSFGMIELASKQAVDAINDYVAASEEYRRKVTGGSSKAVTALKWTKTGCFIVAQSIAASYVGPQAAGAIFGFVEAASEEIGEYVAGNERSGDEIANHVVGSTIFGLAAGAVGGAVIKNLGPLISKALAPALLQNVVIRRIVTHLIEKEASFLMRTVQVEGQYIAHAGVEVIVKLIMRASAKFGAPWIKKKLAQCEDIVAEAFLDYVKKAPKGVDDQVIAKNVGAALVKSEFATYAVKQMIVELSDDIKVALEAAGDGESEKDEK